MGSGWYTTIVIGIIIVIGILFVILRRRIGSRSQRSKNVIRMTEFKKQDKRNGHQQKCSYCKKKTDRLTFYAGGHGSAVGVCRECRPKAERQDLHPI